MLAVKRLQLIDLSSPAEEPQIQYKFKMYFDPQKKLHPTSAKLTELNEVILKNEPEFNTDAIDAMNSFLSCLEKPVCLIAHNGFRFHFPILQYHIDKLNASLLGDIMCSDSIYAFYDILEPEMYDLSKEIDEKKIADEESESSDDDEVLDKNESLNKIIKRSKYKKIGPKKFHKLWRAKFCDLLQPQASYKLNDIYSRVADGQYLKSHHAENQCIMIMKIAIARTNEFIEWVDRNHSPFSEVPIIKMSN